MVQQSEEGEEEMLFGEEATKGRHGEKATSSAEQPVGPVAVGG